MPVEWTSKGVSGVAQSSKILDSHFYFEVEDSASGFRSSGYFFNLLRSWDENKNFSRSRGDVLVSIFPLFLAAGNLAAFLWKTIVTVVSHRPRENSRRMARSRRNVIVAMSSWGEMFIWDLLIFSTAPSSTLCKRQKVQEQIKVVDLFTKRCEMSNSSPSESLERPFRTQFARIAIIYSLKWQWYASHTRRSFCVCSRWSPKLSAQVESTAESITCRTILNVCLGFVRPELWRQWVHATTDDLTNILWHSLAELADGDNCCAVMQILLRD